MSDPFLSQPDTTRVIFELDGKFRVAGCSMRGWRRNMEDAYSALMDPLGDGSFSFFCVCDGHGGPRCAQEVTAHIAEWIKACPMLNNPNVAARTYAEGLAWVVGKAEERLQRLHNEGVIAASGTTFVGVLLTKTHIFCANVGDSRAVMCRGVRGVDLSRDHKPNSASEVQRVQAAGGVIRNGRLGGLLAMTRALGDFELKNPQTPAQKQALLAIPEVSSCSRILTSKKSGVETQQEATFLILACDGIWDCLTSQEAVQFFLEENVCHPDCDVAGLCEALTRMIVAPRLQPIGSDNMTIMVIVTKPSGGPAAAGGGGGGDGAAAGGGAAAGAGGGAQTNAAAAAQQLQQQQQQQRPPGQ